jgi:hypothetical protein
MKEASYIVDAKCQYAMLMVQDRFYYAALQSWDIAAMARSITEQNQKLAWNRPAFWDKIRIMAITTILLPIAIWLVFFAYINYLTNKWFRIFII